MKLNEIFNVQYTIRRQALTYFTVSKFSDDKEPDAVYDVIDRGSHYWTTSPGFKFKGQEEKHIRLVKQFLTDGEPLMRTYSFDDTTGKITSHNI